MSQVDLQFWNCNVVATVVHVIFVCISPLMQNLAKINISFGISTLEHTAEPLLVQIGS